jgi:hypothetical protein
MADVASGSATVRTMHLPLVVLVATSAAGKLQSQMHSLSPCPMDLNTYSKSAVKRGSIPFSNPIVW